MTIEGPANNEKELITSLEGDNWVLTTELASVDKADEEFERRLKEKGWTEDEIFWPKLGFREALINAIGHGNLEIKDSKKNIGELISEELEKDPKKKNLIVRVSIKLDEDRIEITISDSGKGFNHKNIADPTSDEGVKKTSGRGIFLLKKFYTKVDFNEKGNELTLIKEGKQEE